MVTICCVLIEISLNLSIAHVQIVDLSGLEEACEGTPPYPEQVLAHYYCPKGPLTGPVREYR